MRYSTTQSTLRSLDAAILDPAFNVLTLRMAESIDYEVVPFEPYANLEEMKADFEETGTLLVTSRFDSNSIYGDVAVNHAARAWHDYAHIQVNAEFDVGGERLAAELQCAHVDLEWFYGRISDAERVWFKRILDVEVNGNVRHYLQTGAFPENGFKFAVQELF